MDQRERLVQERKDIEKRSARLVAAIESGSDAASLVAKLRQLETRNAAIDTEMASLRPIPRLAPAVVEGRLAEWRRLLRASTTQGRTVLQRIIRGRISFTPRRNPISDELDGYDFEATTHFGKLFMGLAVERPKSLERSTKGCEGIGPEDTFDGDYGRLLDQAFENAGKGWRARGDSRKGGQWISPGLLHDRGSSRCDKLKLPSLWTNTEKHSEHI